MRGERISDQLTTAVTIAAAATSHAKTFKSHAVISLSPLIPGESDPRQAVAFPSKVRRLFFPCVSYQIGYWCAYQPTPEAGNLTCAPVFPPPVINNNKPSVIHRPLRKASSSAFSHSSRPLIRNSSHSASCSNLLPTAATFKGVRVVRLETRTVVRQRKDLRASDSIATLPQVAHNTAQGPSSTPQLNWLMQMRCHSRPLLALLGHLNLLMKQVAGCCCSLKERPIYSDIYTCR